VNTLNNYTFLKCYEEIETVAVKENNDENRGLEMIQK
jgi:hypothetical protein